MNDITKTIISHLPYGSGFTLVDEIINVSLNHIEGKYTFRTKDFDFFTDHFPGNPIVPGVIQTECLGQIGLVCLFIYIMMTERGITDFTHIKPAITSFEVDFLKPLFPDEEVRITSRKVYFRLNKLKCYTEMYNKGNDLICKGHISGIYLED